MYPDDEDPFVEARLDPWTWREEVRWRLRRARLGVRRLLVPAALFAAGVLLTLGATGGRDQPPSAAGTPSDTEPSRPGLAARLPEGTRAVVIPTTQPTPPLVPEQLVDVLARAPLGAESTTDDVRVLAIGALVLAVDDRGVSVAVPEAAAPAVVGAVLDGRVALTLAG